MFMELQYVRTVYKLQNVGLLPVYTIICLLLVCCSHIQFDFLFLFVLFVSVVLSVSDLFCIFRFLYVSDFAVGFCIV